MRILLDTDRLRMYVTQSKRSPSMSRFRPDGSYMSEKQPVAVADGHAHCVSEHDHFGQSMWQFGRERRPMAFMALVTWVSVYFSPICIRVRA